MKNIIEYIANHYVIFLTLLIFLLFSLIGYIIDTIREKNDVFKKKEREFEETDLDNLVIDEDKKISDSILETKNKLNDNNINE